MTPRDKAYTIFHKFFFLFLSADIIEMATLNAQNAANINGFPRGGGM